MKCLGMGKSRYLSNMAKCLICGDLLEYKGGDPITCRCGGLEIGVNEYGEPYRRTDQHHGHYAEISEVVMFSSTIIILAERCVKSACIEILFTIAEMAASGELNLKTEILNRFPELPEEFVPEKTERPPGLFASGFFVEHEAIFRKSALAKLIYNAFLADVAEKEIRNFEKQEQK